MPERHVGPDELARARFAVSPVWEAVASLRALQRPAGPHAAWVAVTATRLRAERLDLSALLTLVPPTGHIADLLTPTPSGRIGDIDRGLEVVRAHTPEEIRRDLVLLGADRADAAPSLRAALSDPEPWLVSVLSTLRAYWDLSLAPTWPRLRALAEADVAWRLEQAATHGMSAAFEALHPRLRLVRGGLVVRATCLPKGLGPADHGLVLVPSAFAWPEILVLDRPAQPMTISYTCRGVGTLWEHRPAPADPLARLLGVNRAAVLTALEQPMTTTELADHVGITAPSTNAHLKVLWHSGLVTRRRRGRAVDYLRSPLGTDLVTAHATEHRVGLPGRSR